MVSIIVPVYNAQESLETCVKSILMQSYKNYEIILIDDGSTDNSLSICESLKKKSDKITVLSQNNSGVSAARNNGIKKSKGEYLLFIDADDVVEKTMLETLMKKSENDIVISGFKVIGSDLIKNDTSALKSLEKINVDKELLLKKLYLHLKTECMDMYGGHCSKQKL